MIKDMFFKNTIIFVFLLFISTSSFAKETIVFAIDIVRHGDRAPLRFIPKSSYKWKIGEGDLTPKGMRQEFELGVLLRKRYVDEYHLLPKKYQQNTMRIYSTKTDRTLMSAQSLLLGLYPLGTGPKMRDGKPGLPEAFQPIPIHIKRWNKESKKMCTLKYNQYVSSSRIKKDKEQLDEKLKGNFKRWGMATGLKITSISDESFDFLADALIVYKLNNLPVPFGLNKKDVEKIIEVEEELFVDLLKDKEVSGYCRGKSRLVDVVDYLKKVAEQKVDLKYVLFSDHLTTIGEIMALLDNPVNKIPPHASDLNFLLFKDSSGSYKVKINYNGEPLIMLGCGGKDCSLDQFIKLIDAV